MADREEVKRGVIKSVLLAHFELTYEQLMLENNRAWRKWAGIKDEADLCVLLQEILYDTSPETLEALLKEKSP